MGFRPAAQSAQLPICETGVQHFLGTPFVLVDAEFEQLSLSTASVSPREVWRERRCST